MTAHAPGTLNDQLRRAAAEVIIDKGLGAFSIREVARRAGVSHAAPGYHFRDARGLLTALAIEGFETLSREMAAAAELHADPVDRLTAIGRAYVHVATKFPAHCQVIFREDLVDAGDEQLSQAGLCAFGILEATVQAIVDAEQIDVDVFDASKLCWSAMQGLVQLLPKLQRMDQLRGQAPLSAEETVARFTPLFVIGLRR